MEADAQLLIDGTEVEIGQDGAFSHVVTATGGENIVSVVTRDQAGNETVRKVEFSFMKDDSREIGFDPSLPRDSAGRFLTAGETLTVSGKVLNDAKISVLDAQDVRRSETYADPSGAFLVNVPLEGDVETLTIQVTAASGHSFSQTIETLVLDTPPQIGYAKPLPAVTAEPRLTLNIVVDQEAEITVNGISPEQDGVDSSITLDLTEGPNLIETVATNAVGLVTIDKRTVIFDSLKPVLSNQVVSVEPTGDKELVSMKVGAKDATGVAKTSRYRVQIGDQEYRGVLRYNRARKSYQGKTEVPLRMNDEDMTIEIEIADVAGNISIVTLTQ